MSDGQSWPRNNERTMPKQKPKRKRATKKLPSQGGCWYCHGDTAPLVFSCEFDTYLHEKCLRAAMGDKGDAEAAIMGRELGIVA